MNNNKHLTYEERKLIEKYLKDGYSLRLTSTMLNRSHFAITNEIKRSGLTKDSYDAEIAHSTSIQVRRKLNAYKQKTFTDEECEIIKDLIQKGSSLTHICNTLGTGKRCLLRQISLLGFSANQLKPQTMNALIERVESLEMQLEILTETIEGLINDRKN